MNEKFNEYKKILKELNDRNIFLSDLLIWQEINDQLDKKLTDSELEILYNTVERCYYKAENADLYNLVNYCINNLDKLYDMEIWEIILHSNC